MRVPPVPHPPTSHRSGENGHHPGTADPTPQKSPRPISQATPSAEPAILGHVWTPWEAPSMASRLIVRSRRSNQSYCRESTTVPAKSMSSPGPGRNSAATPRATSVQPSTSRPRRLAAT